MLLSVLLASGLASAAGSSSPLNIGNCEFGEVVAFGTVDCWFRLTNTSERPLTVSIEPRQPGDAAEPAHVTIPVKGTVDVATRVAIGNAMGEVKHHYRITIAGTSGEGFAIASGFALGSLDELKPSLSFGNVELTDPPPEKQIELSSRDIADFRILRITDSPQAVDASIAPDGRTLKVRIRPDAPWAVLDDYIKLAINTPRQKEAWVHVGADVHGQVSAEKNPVSFGFVAPGTDRQVSFDLNHSEGKSFRIGSMNLEGFDGRASITDCEPAKVGCQSVVLHIADDRKPGFIRGVLDVELPDYDRELALNVWGILQSAPAPEATTKDDTTKVKSPSGAEAPTVADSAVDAEDPAATETVASGGSESAPDRPSSNPSDTKTPSGKRRADSPVSEPLTQPPGSGPLLKWSTAVEGSVHGYQIFRSDAASGPFVLQNAKTIPAHPDTGSIYQWRDTAVEQGKAYWYYVGVVYKNGKKEKLSPPQRTVAK